MKGLLGRKAGMTSVFTNLGQNIPVTVIEIQPNIVTNVLSQDKHGYKALQLSAFDRREKTSTKPEIGHFKKANTSAKYFVREIRNMDGYDLGAKIDASIFAVGELVDITGTSKGKGFQGAIKRHNQKIGPKSHGGGGGSKPTRQTGGLGGMINKNSVQKGMTMPGHMGNETNTVQNLEIIAIDIANSSLLVKGSIPGANKGFVVIKEAIKGLPAKEAVKLVDVNEAAKMNALIEEAKKWGANINTEMPMSEIELAIATAKESYEAEQKAKEAHEVEEKAKAEVEKIEAAAAKAQDDLDKAEKSGDQDSIKEAEEKAASLEKQKDAVEEKVKEAEAEAKEADIEAASKEAEAEKHQVDVEEVKEEPKKSEDKAEKSEGKGDK